MKKKKKQMIVVNVSEVKTRSDIHNNPTHVYRPRKRYIAARDAERKKTHECL